MLSKRKRSQQNIVKTQSKNIGENGVTEANKETENLLPFLLYIVK